MNRRSFLSGLGVGVLGLTAGAGMAHAQVFGRWEYRRYHYYEGRGADLRRREALRLRLFDLGDRVHDAERDGAISRRRAEDLFDRLDRVRDFLRDDRHLTGSEFERRRDDLDDVARGLRYSSRGGRSRDDWYDRYDQRYRRDDRYNRY